MDVRFKSGALQLSGHLAVPANHGPRVPGVVLCHGFPSSEAGAADAVATYPQLADRIANELGWCALSFGYRAVGGSDGQFSLRGWLDDTLAAVAYVRELEGMSGVWIAGFGTGGALAVCAAAADRDVRGVAALAVPADFDDWASQPRRLLQHSRELGLVTDPRFPASFDTWASELRAIRAVHCVTQLLPRPLLVVHGTNDESVPALDGRAVADAHGSAELRIISGADHQLRHDPRAVAILLGWLDRQRHAA